MNFIKKFFWIYICILFTICPIITKTFAYENDEVAELVEYTEMQEDVKLEKSDYDVLVDLNHITDDEVIPFIQTTIEKIIFKNNDFFDINFFKSDISEKHEAGDFWVILRNAIRTIYRLLVYIVSILLLTLLILGAIFIVFSSDLPENPIKIKDNNANDNFFIKGFKNVGKKIGTFLNSLSTGASLFQKKVINEWIKAVALLATITVVMSFLTFTGQELSEYMLRIQGNVETGLTLKVYAQYVGGKKRPALKIKRTDSYDSNSINYAYERLQSEINELVKDDGKWAVYVRNLTNNVDAVKININSQMTSASTIKLFIAKMAYEKLNVTNSIEEKIRKMISESDNNAANDLIDAIYDVEKSDEIQSGFDAFNNYMGNNGYTSTVLHRYFGKTNYDISEENVTSARDVGKILNEIYNKSFTGADKILEFMLNQSDSHKNKIPEGIKESGADDIYTTKIANKTGELQDKAPIYPDGPIENDSAIVYKDDANYLITILSSNTNDDSGTISKIKEIAGKVHVQINQTSGALIIIGDSRTTQMGTYLAEETIQKQSNDMESTGTGFIGRKDEDYFVSKGGCGLEWAKISGFSDAEAYIKSGTNIIIWLGTNDAYGGESMANDYSNTLNARAGEWQSKGANVYFASVGPAREDGGTGQSVENNIVPFNELLKSKLNNSIKWIDVYTYIKNMGDSVFQDYCHYNNETSKKIYDYFKKQVGSGESRITSSSSSSDSSEESKKYTVVVDAGHGDPSLATQGYFTSGTFWTDPNTNITYNEWELTQEVVDKIINDVSKKYTNIEFIQTGKNEERLDFAKQSGADAYVGVHFNSSGSNSSGTFAMTKNGSGNESSIQLGEKVAKKVADKFGLSLLHTKGVDSEGTENRVALKLASNCGFPNIYIEGLFMSDVDMAEFLKNGKDDGIKRYAEGIVEGVAEYLNVSASNSSSARSNSSNSNSVKDKIDDKTEYTFLTNIEGLMIYLLQYDTVQTVLKSALCVLAVVIITLFKTLLAVLFFVRTIGIGALIICAPLMIVWNYVRVVLGKGPLWKKFYILFAFLALIKPFIGLMYFIFFKIFDINNVVLNMALYVIAFIVIVVCILYFAFLKLIKIMQKEEKDTTSRINERDRYLEEIYKNAVSRGGNVKEVEEQYKNIKNIINKKEVAAAFKLGNMGVNEYEINQVGGYSDAVKKLVNGATKRAMKKNMSDRDIKDSDLYDMMDIRDL